MNSLEIAIPRNSKMHRIAREAFNRENQRLYLLPSKEARSKKHAEKLFKHFWWLFYRYVRQINESCNFSIDYTNSTLYLRPHGRYESYLIVKITKETKNELQS